MSTEKAKKKRIVPRTARVKILEYGAIGLVALLLLVPAILYGGKRSESAPAEAEVSSSPVPTPDPSIRGKNVLDAIEDSPFTLQYLQDHYDLLSPDGVPFTLRMRSDEAGLTELTVTTLLCADPDEDTEIAELLRSQNKQTVAALRDLLDRLMPVFRRTVADSDTIVKQCLKVVETGAPYSKHMGRFTVRVQSDPEEIPQSVSITFLRDS